MRLRRALSSSWVLALVLSVATGLTVSRLVDEAAARARRLGGLRPVPVAARSVAAGEVLGPADVSVRSLPSALLPEGALAPSPVGRVAVVPLIAGEALLAAKLAPDGLRGAEALLPRGHRALAVPVPPGALVLRPGQRVDVLATFDAGEGDGGPPTFAVASAAVVLDVAEEWVTVGVGAEEAPRVAFAVARGTVALALTGPA